MSGKHSGRLFGTGAALAAAIAVVAGWTTAAQALTVHVDQDATWRYINATSGTTQTVDSDWFEKGYDDSGWSTGPAPFSSGATSGTFGADFSNVDDPFDSGAGPVPGTFTQWDVNFDPYVRVEFTLAAKTDLTVWLAVDNGINSMYLNGALATAGVNAEGQAHRWEHVFDVDSSFTHVGTNVLALQLEDHGGSTAFTLVVTDDDETENPDFIEVPAPGAPALLGLGLLGLAAIRRWRRG